MLIKEECMNTDSLSYAVNEEFIADIKKEFYEKYDGNYGSDVTKELKILYYGEFTKDIKYHGKHRGYNMFTYVDENNVLMAVCPVLRLDMSENDIGKRDIDLLIEELRDLIDWWVSYLKKDSNKYYSSFLGKYIRV